jgi:hypothetical protein
MMGLGSSTTSEKNCESIEFEIPVESTQKKITRQGARLFFDPLFRTGIKSLRI